MDRFHQVKKYLDSDNLRHNGRLDPVEIHCGRTNAPEFPDVHRKYDFADTHYHSV